MNQIIAGALEGVEAGDTATVLAAFSYHDLKTFQKAHDEACFWLARSGGIGPGWEVRATLARRIIQCADSGERDVQKLKAYALSGLSSLATAEGRVSHGSLLALRS